MKSVLKHLGGPSRQDGVALLFALGFLSMLLVLGLGFVTTSLLSQKVAANNSTRAQARMLARSAAARAAMSILLYNDQAIVGTETLNNYDAICSYDEVDHYDGTGAEKAPVYDQLRRSTTTSLDESKLKYQVGSMDYSGEYCNAKWLFFYDAPEGATDRRIIGRAAFQVLPRGAGRLSLYGVLGGAKLENDMLAIPWNFRWGRGVEELFVNNSSTLNGWKDEAVATAIPSEYGTLYDSYSSFFTTNTADRKSWIEYWFAEGQNPILKEAYPIIDQTSSDKKGTLFINRFNVGDYYYKSADRNSKDNWYDRFLSTGEGSGGWSDVSDSNKNSDAAVDALTRDGLEYREDDSEDSALDPFGLPFLKRIGNEPHSFPSIEARRRQIAANFNDYCDSDSIPTSDQTAGSWNVQTETSYPTYTGNEKTLYINEAALELGDITASFSAGALSAGGTNHSKVEISSITPSLIAELINMYDNTGDVPTLKPENFEFQTALKKLSFNLALKVTFDVKFTYTIGSPATTRDGSTTVTVDYTDNAVAKINFAPTAPAAKTVDNFKALDSGYSIGTVALDAIADDAITQPDSDIFSNKIDNAAKAAVPSGGTFSSYTSITVTNIGYQLRTDGESKIEFLPFLLKAKNNLVEDGKTVLPAGTGVDFVRMDRTGEMTVSGDPAAAADEASSGSEHKFATTAYIGGIEARDPRQNLNPKYDDPATSDWNLYPTLVDNNAAGTTIPSMTVVPNGATLDARVTAGLPNRGASPNAPQYLNAGGALVSLGGSVFDTEEASDPAWLGESSGDHVSTAYIRNAPMVSPWEIGLIHRGREWQTLNIKKAGGFDGETSIKLEDMKSSYNWTDAGTTYENGDGGIMDMIKMGTICRSMGKVPLPLLRSGVISSGDDWNKVPATMNKDIIKALFDNIRVGQTMKQFYEESKFDGATVQGGTTITTNDTTADSFVTEIDSLTASSTPEFKLRSQFLNSAYGESGNTFNLAGTANDALKEELIGKTINLLTVGEETPPNIFKVLVVAQTIRDIGGVGGNSIPVTKIHNGSNETVDCELGRFEYIQDNNNWENNTYFDEITGEVKALVTIERVPAQNDIGENNTDYGRMVITGIEYID